MTAIHRLETLAGQRGELHLAIGVFDGVHLGHQAVLKSCIDAAREGGGHSCLVTFEPHPARVLRPAGAPRLLTRLPHKLKLAAGLGVEHALVVPFTREFSQSTAAEFINSLLTGGTRVRSVSVGQDWRFGCDRSGNLDALRRIGEANGFGVCGVAPLHRGGRLVSSTHIRSLVETGILDDARLFLGRRFSVLGRVEHGRQLGRSLGFPTANVGCAGLQLPPLGVYAGWANRCGETHGAVVNLGVCPTVAGGAQEVRLEVHLLGYEGREFYGEELEIAFVRQLRGERRFESVTALAAQITRDAEHAREILAANPPC